MNIKMITYLIAWILKIEAVFMVPALLIAMAGKESESFTGFRSNYNIFHSQLGHIISQAGKINFYAREGFVTVALFLILMSFFGALSFYISGQIPSFVDSFFETVSGFTTTGSSILTDVEALI